MPIQDEVENTLTEEEFLALVKRDCKGWSLRFLAPLMGVNYQFLSAFLLGNRKAGTALPKYYGYEAITLYRRTKS